MKACFPIIRGLIIRRILVNFRAEPSVVARALPPPFRPKLVHGHAMVGICLIRLEQIRPRVVPVRIGLSSNNAAHRIAVDWSDAYGPHEGVFILRRDTSSMWQALAGERFFPGRHHHARFNIEDGGGHQMVTMAHRDGTRIKVRAGTAEQWPSNSVFSSLDDASRFFERGSIGYSPARQPGKFDGMELRCLDWRMLPLAVETAESTFFSDEHLFPTGSIKFDCALLMQNIEHEWLAQSPICASDHCASTCENSSPRTERNAA